MSLTKPKHTRQTFMGRVQLAMEASPGDEVMGCGHTILQAGISPSTASVLLEVDDKTVRRWFLGETKPRRADMTRLSQLANKIVAATESGALPKRGATLLEIIGIINAQKELVVATEI